MLRPLVEALKHCPRRRRHEGALVIGAAQSFDVIKRVEAHDGGELDLVADGAPQEVDAAVTFDPFRLDHGKDFSLHDALIGIGIRGRGPAVPNAKDHPDQTQTGG